MMKVKLDAVTFSNEDCVEFLQKHGDSGLIYADPPYFIKSYIYGRDGDLHSGFDHEAFAKELKKHPKWVLSYNDCEYIRKLYSDCRILERGWAYGMVASKPSSEIIILPPEEAREKAGTTPKNGATTQEEASL